MSRIRSIHPALFTDPEFVQVSMAARMLLIGLWTECDDRGVFEWKPLALKMKIFPADAVDMDALLGELVAAERIRQVELEGKNYGICRNFAKYQRPKNPSYRYPFSPAWAEFIALKLGNVDSPTPALPQSSASTPEKSPQMEDGEKEEEEKKERGAREDFEKFWEPYPKKQDRGQALKAFLAVRKRGLPLETLVAGAERYAADPKRDPGFTKNGATWLNGECWNDEPATAPPSLTDDQREANRLACYAELIKRKVSPGLGFTPQDRHKLISRGLATPEQIEAAGCAA